MVACVDLPIMLNQILINADVAVGHPPTCLGDWLSKFPHLYSQRPHCTTWYSNFHLPSDVEEGHKDIKLYIGPTTSTSNFSRVGATQAHLLMGPSSALPVGVGSDTIWNILCTSWPKLPGQWSLNQWLKTIVPKLYVSSCRYSYI